MCGSILGWPIVAYYFWVTVTLSSDLVFRIMVPRAFVLYILKKEFKRGSCMVWEIKMGVYPRLDFENIMFFNCLGYIFNIYGAFEFLCNSIANL